MWSAIPGSTPLQSSKASSKSFCPSPTRWSTGVGKWIDREPYLKIYKIMTIDIRPLKTCKPEIVLKLNNKLIEIIDLIFFKVCWLYFYINVIQTQMFKQQSKEIRDEPQRQQARPQKKAATLPRVYDDTSDLTIEHQCLRPSWSLWSFIISSIPGRPVIHEF